MLCKKIFCCRNCKQKHIVNDHSEGVQADCPLCENSENIVLRFSAIQPFFAHIVRYHLPLGCLKCNEIIETEADMRKLDHSCMVAKVQDPDPPAIVVTNSDGTAEVPTADSLANVSVQAKTPKSSFLSQMACMRSASLVKSASMAYMSTTSNTYSQVTTKLIRSTSTPTTQELMCVKKTTNQFLNGSVSQMSSICNHSSVIATSPLGCTPMAPKMDKFKMPTHQMVRNKGFNVQTPLRQVMSQNVQRALLKNHEFLLNNSTQPYNPSSK